jgi:hypothetical protein
VRLKVSVTHLGRNADFQSAVSQNSVLPGAENTLRFRTLGFLPIGKSAIRQIENLRYRLEQCPMLLIAAACHRALFNRRRGVYTAGA